MGSQDFKTEGPSGRGGGVKPGTLIGGILVAGAIGWALARTLAPGPGEPPPERPSRSRAGSERTSRSDPAKNGGGGTDALPPDTAPPELIQGHPKEGTKPSKPSETAEPEPKAGELSPKMLAYMSKMLDARERLKQKPETFAEMGHRLELTEGQLRQIRYIVGQESDAATGEVVKEIEGRGYRSLSGLEAMSEERRWEEFQVIGRAVQRARERYDESYRELGLTDKQLELLRETRQQFRIEGDDETIRIGVTRLVQD